MRTLKSQGMVHNTDYAKFPEGGIKNETTTQEGTPVVEQNYGDVLSNIYKYILSRGIAFNNIQDNELNGYQFIDALKLHVNELNDVERVLTKTGLVWSVNFKLSLVPDKYFFFARPTDNYNDLEVYTFKGTEATEYSFSSPGFNSGDELLVIVDHNGVRAYSFQFFTNPAPQNPKEIFTILGTPLSFTEKLPIHYFSEGKVFNDTPIVYDFQTIIQTQASNLNLELVDVLHQKDKFICLCIDITTNYYEFFLFEDSDLATSISCPVNGFVINNVINEDYSPIMIGDENYIYLTNNCNASADHTEMIRLALNNSNELDFDASFGLDASFPKTTNVVSRDNGFYTFIDEVLSFNHSNGSAGIVITQLPVFNGYLFNVKSTVYYTNGEVAKIWDLSLP